jgi:(2Fe-2S) ferredoxin
VSDYYLTGVPETVVPVGDGLLAMGFYGWGGGPQTLWHSPDGVTWTRVESQSWHDAWLGRTIRGIAGGPSGAVAIGAEGSGCCMNPAGEPIVLFSPDGAVWKDVTPQAPAPAIVSDVASFHAGFILGGEGR